MTDSKELERLAATNPDRVNINDIFDYIRFEAGGPSGRQSIRAARALRKIAKNNPERLTSGVYMLQLIRALEAKDGGTQRTIAKAILLVAKRHPEELHPYTGKLIGSIEEELSKSGGILASGHNKTDVTKIKSLLQTLKIVGNLSDSELSRLRELENQKISSGLTDEIINGSPKEITYGLRDVISELSH